MTLRDLIEGITEIQGEVVVRQFSHDADDIIGENPLGEIRSDSSAWSNEILYNQHFKGGKALLAGQTLATAANAV